MLRLRPAQRDEIEGALVDPILARDVCAFLEAERPAACGVRGVDAIQELAALAVRRCRELGMAKRSSFYWYALIALEVSPSFEEEPAIGARLGDAAIDADDRIEFVLRETTAEEWERARARSHRRERRG